MASKFTPPAPSPEVKIQIYIKASARHLYLDVCLLCQIQHIWNWIIDLSPKPVPPTAFPMVVAATSSILLGAEAESLTCFLPFTPHNVSIRKSWRFCLEVDPESSTSHRRHTAVNLLCAAIISYQDHWVSLLPVSLQPDDPSKVNRVMSLLRATPSPVILSKSHVSWQASGSAVSQSRWLPDLSLLPLLCPLFPELQPHGLFAWPQFGWGLCISSSFCLEGLVLCTSTADSLTSYRSLFQTSVR